MPVLNPPGSSITSVPSSGSNLLPATTPQAFASYVNANFTGTNGKKGSPQDYLSSLGYTGSTLGAQWLSFWSAEQAKFGSQYSLEQAEQAFVVLWEEGTLGTNLAQASAGGLAAAGGFAQIGTVTGAQEAGSIFSVLQSGSLWLRLAEGFLGIVLIAIGIAKLTNAVPVATKIAKTAGAVAI